MNTINSLDRLTQTLQKIQGAYAPSTIRAFKSDLENFIAYCSKEDQVALPSTPASVANFIEHLTTQKLSSSYIRRIVASISTIHKLNRFNDPTQDPDVKIAMKKMHRTVGRFQHQAEPINKDILLKMIEVTEDSLMGDRDRVLLSIAYDTLCRRSELVSLRIEDVYLIDSDWRNETERSKIFLRASKTDQERQGRWLYLNTATVNYIKVWLKKSGLKNGFLLQGVRRGNHMTAQINAGQINRIYKRLARLAHINQETIRHISGHSIRIGAAQDLMRQGATLPHIMVKGHWRKQDTVMRYIENVKIDEKRFYE